MAPYDFSAPRLFLDAPLAAGAHVPLDRAQANYLLNVLRLKPGGRVLVFNGRNGEWRASLAEAGRKSAALVLQEQARPQVPPGDLLYLFAPLKSARLDYMVQKAVEMGVSALQPVFTRRTQAARVNRERMRANAVEAAEQCGILSIPEILPEADFPRALGALEADRLLVFCDEEAPVANPVQALSDLRDSTAKAAVAVGPEGGFTEEERALALRHPRVVRVSLGPRILRADTAAVAALGLVQAVLGDWR
ncbi:MAG TPA: 16S rRNA (uracil(1498)-N(3))-methyltransferase [Beijerinckiaceae bacterium]